MLSLLYQKGRFLGEIGQKQAKTVSFMQFFKMEILYIFKSA